MTLDEAFNAAAPVTTRLDAGQLATVFAILQAQTITAPKSDSFVQKRTLLGELPTDQAMRILTAIRTVAAMDPTAVSDASTKLLIESVIEIKDMVENPNQGGVDVSNTKTAVAVAGIAQMGVGMTADDATALINLGYENVPAWPGLTLAILQNLNAVRTE